MLIYFSFLLYILFVTVEVFMCNKLCILFVYFYVCLVIAVSVLIFELNSIYLFILLCPYFVHLLFNLFFIYLHYLFIYLLKYYLFYFISLKWIHFILFGLVTSGTGTRYGLNGSGIESRWGEMFCTCSDWPCYPPSLLYNRQLISFPAVKRAGVAVDHLPTSSAEVKERAEVCPYSPSGPAWPHCVVKFTFYIWSQVRSSHVCLG